MVLLEVCTETVDGARAAAAGGAGRVELCTGLNEGGLTPSAGAILGARRSLDIELCVLIRPRRGDFLYSPADLETMRADLRVARDLGADCVALGCLRPDASIDRDTLARLVDAARPLEVTFHRAFDVTSDLAASLAVLIELGVDRVLTSGGQPNVEAGLDTLCDLVDQAAGKIKIMPGGGVRETNARRVILATGVDELHASVSSWNPSRMHSAAPLISFDAAPTKANSQRTVEEVAVRRLLQTMH